MKHYEMKDLGYPRIPTPATYVVTMPDGTKWSVPVQVIADSRDTHYADEQEDTIGFIRAGGLSRFEIQDWAGNNMNWSDVKDYATEVPRPFGLKVDFEEGWSNGEKEIRGDV